MSHPLDSIWIIGSESGICYLHRVLNEEKDFGDETMFSWFISSIINFVTSTTQESIEGIVLGGFDIHIKTFSGVIVVLSTKKNAVLKNLYDLMDQVGKDFLVAFKDKMDGGIVSVQDFENYGENIDQIFGLKTIQIIPEHETLIEIINRSEKENIPEDKALELIVTFFKTLPDYKRRIIIENINKILISVLRDPSKAAMLTNITADVSEEQLAFKQLLKNAQQNNLSEDDLIKEIVVFFDSVSVNKRTPLLIKIKGAVDILKPSKKIDKDTKKKFDTLINLV